MSEIIRNYYLKANIPDFILQRKAELFDRNPDIAAEFEYWIVNKAFPETDCVCVENYTAAALCELNVMLKGEGAFTLLAELRENPEKAKNRIASGFKIK